MPRPEAKEIYDAVIGGAVAASRRLIDFVHDGSLARYVGVMLVAIIAVGAAGFAGGTYKAGTRATLPPSLPGVAAWVALVAASAAVAVRHRDGCFAGADRARRADRLDCLMQFSAPDLALTQITVDVVTTILLLLALNLLPRESESRRAERAGCTPAWRRSPDRDRRAVLCGDDAEFRWISGYYLRRPSREAAAPMSST